MADPPKRRGRPPLDPGDPSIKVTVSVPSRQFDAFARRALRHDVSVPEVIRRVLRAQLPKADGKP